MKRLIILLFGIFMFSLLNAKRLSFNDGWLFRQSISDKWESVNIPHSWNSDAYSVKDYYKGKSVYKKTFSLNPEDSTRHFILRFEGVSKRAEIKINGQEAGWHDGGYTAFVIPVTPFVSFSMPNTIEVVVDNDCNDIPPHSGDFTFFGGLYRDIWLEDYDDISFAQNPFAAPGIRVTPKLEYGLGAFIVEATLSNHGRMRGNTKLTIDLIDPQGNVIDTFRKKIRIDGNSDLTTTHTFKYLVAPQLWSPENPALYKIRATLTDDKGNETDRQTINTGLRDFFFDKDGRFYLNGTPLKLHGVCRHQDMKPFGPALNDESHRRDMLIAKDMGANFIRVSHYPQDPAILDMADKLGLLVWEEIPIIDVVPDNKKYQRNCEIALREMISQHYNHPSIIMWGYMNEILLKAPGDASPEGSAVLERTKNLAARLETLCRKMDPTRFTTMAFHGSERYRTSGISQLPMINGWNLYQGWYGGDLSGFEQFLKKEWEADPGKPIIVSEYGAGSDRRLHSLSPRPFDFSMEYQQKYLEHYLGVIEDSSFVAGASHWNLIDFGSALREESMPRINNKGILYSDRTPKDVYHLFKASWRKDIDHVYIASRDWPKRVAVTDSLFATMPIKVYANTPKVSLIVNGRHVADKETVKNVVVFDVPLGIGNNSIIARGGNCVDGFNIDVASIPIHLNNANIEGTEIAVNVGSNCCYVSPVSGMTWVEDRDYSPGSWGRTGGEMKNSTSEIFGTPDGALFQSAAKGIEGYRFDVPDGEYELELGFADTSGRGSALAYMLERKTDDASKGAVFSIVANGEILEKDFSPCNANGYCFACIRKYIVKAKDGAIDIRFIPVTGQPFLNAIKLRRY